ncbi:MAG: shikimate dehydrogenase [Bacteroidales bacterium]|nr:shikimate dehydrogenase [Bacteroidales bacterium]
MTLYGLIGFPLYHSYSQDYFRHKLEREGITDAAYRLFPIENLAMLPEMVRAYTNLKGLNVTIPYKEAVIKYTHQLSEHARNIGAVNVLHISRSGEQPKLTGFNTDWIAFSESLQPLLKEHHQHALVLGTGGAARAVIYALIKLGISYQVVSRQPYAGKHLGYGELNRQIMRKHRLIINATPVGMHPEEEEAPALPYEMLTPDHLCYDLIYNPALTAFLKTARRYGADTKNGLEMFKRQAEESWKIWNET